MSLRDLSQELKELGWRGAAFRTGWELQGRLGFARAHRMERISTAPYVHGVHHRDVAWARNLPFGDATSIARAMSPFCPDDGILCESAFKALSGKVLSFSKYWNDYGSPIDWHLQPITRQRWDADRDLTFSIGNESGYGDIKQTWEIGRFPHAYLIARASAFSPADRDELAEGLFGQIQDFQAKNPFGLGVHWSSGQEIAFRILAWLFAEAVLFSRTVHAASSEVLIAGAMLSGASWIEAHLDYSRIAVYNNHLLSEAIALFGVGALLPLSDHGPRWRKLGRDILEEEAERQFYADGSYIQQSHNYHRVALQDLLWACLFARAMGDRPSKIWLAAMERSLDFLIAHQNPPDGALPNYGANDGSHPSILSSCDFRDFRPTLQAVSLLTRNERLYDSGPWDEEAAWWLGPAALDAPKRSFTRRSVSFTTSGYHVLRGKNETSFGAFRCGSLRDRFSQIDMLHLDVWWRGLNVLVDGGSYQYNAAHHWHNHFTRTGSHNTVTIDDRDQMVHYRQFKVLYWTQAELLSLLDTSDWVLAEGEHYGYRRHPGAAVHRRSVLFIKDDLWIVGDSVLADGPHSAQVHWLGGEFDWSVPPSRNGFDLETTEGSFSVRTLDFQGRALDAVVTAGQEEPPRGWLSRYYGYKVAVPSLVSSLAGEGRLGIVSILSGVAYDCEVQDSRWTIRIVDRSLGFTLSDGRFSEIDFA